MTSLVEKIIRLHESLQSAGLPHAFGGALALAWCTQQARGTIDIDVNVFVEVDQSGNLLEALPDDVAHSEDDATRLARDGQVRLWWDATPVDLFLNTTPFHATAARRARWERFAGRLVPFLSCRDIAVFKAFFNRTKDWADIEEMQAAGTLNAAAVTAVLVEYLGVDDERVDKLSRLLADRAPRGDRT